MGTMEEKAQQKFEADRRRAEEIARKITAEKEQDRRDRAASRGKK
jgi:hypothetical protein